MRMAASSMKEIISAFGAARQTSSLLVAKFRDKQALNKRLAQSGTETMDVHRGN
jgi:hypothetical protein